MASLNFILQETSELLDLAFYFFTLLQHFLEFLYCLGAKLCTG
jgi:hypothetical protein